MGRKAGGKNYANMAVEVPMPINITEAERETLPKIYTCFEKDIISIEDFMSMSGLSYSICAKIVREIKSISDVLNIQGCVHRTDYFMYLSRRFQVQKGNGDE